MDFDRLPNKSLFSNLKSALSGKTNKERPKETFFRTITYKYFFPFESISC